MSSPTSVGAYLISRGWEPSGRTTIRRGKNGRDRITWWLRGGYEYPQHLALDLERLGWVKILETL